MAKQNQKVVTWRRRKKHIRRRVSGTPERPRLTVYRSLRHIYAQVVDDVSGRTLASSSSVALKIQGGNAEMAKAVGKAVGEAAQAQGVHEVCFDRAGFKYHGRVKALADAAREAGLNF